MVFELTPRFVARLLMANLAVLVSCNVAVQLVFLVTDHDNIMGLRPFFDMSGEWNAPAIYSGFLILINGLFLALIGFRSRIANKSKWIHWYILSVIFLYLSSDEVFSFHERLGAPVRDALHSSGLLYFAWVIPGGIFTLVVLVASLSWLRRLETATRRLMLSAGTVYVTGAIGIEMLGGWRYERVKLGLGLNDPWFMLLSTCEETLEIAGMSLMLFTLIRHATSAFGPIRSPLPRFH
ncbi:MAG: hypothetical protein WD673_14340 [Alphaproteobacteria bacterium]